jgi:hypothetical protein
MPAEKHVARCNEQQSANVLGNHNIVVQINGDGIHVTVGLPHLTLVPPRNRIPRAPAHPADLLNPVSQGHRVGGTRTRFGVALELAAFWAGGEYPHFDRRRGGGEDACRN